MTDPASPRGNAQPPPVGPEVDLRDFAFMPLDVLRLRDSAMAVTVSAEAFRAAILLWCAAWHQVPAASLPTNDRALAQLAGFGRDLEGWLAVKDEALYGFEFCDDGRLYHGVIAEKAQSAWTSKLARRARTAEATAARQAKRRAAADKAEDGVSSSDQRDEQRNVDGDDQRNEQRHVHQGTGTGTGTGIGTGIGIKKEGPSLRSGDAPAAPKPARKPSKASQIDPAWTPDLVDRDYAIEKGLAPVEIAHEAEQFRDHWLRKGGSASDWRAAWRTWCRYAIKFRDRDRTREQQRPPQSHGCSRFDALAYAAERLSRMEDNDA